MKSLQLSYKRNQHYIHLAVLFWALHLVFLSSKLLADPKIDEIPIHVLKKQNTKTGPDQTWDSKQLSTLEFQDQSRQLRRYLYDFQYGKAYEYKAINLFEWLMSHKLPAHVNTANLVFQNGMIIPMPLNSSQGPLVWLAWHFRQSPKESWQREFPIIEKPSDQWRDPRPLVFQGNKLIVSNQRFFPRPEWDISDDFSPFKHTNSLLRIDLVDYNEWNQQFFVSSLAAALRGQKIFTDRCQFCHSVWGAGAKYGWDFTDPLPVYQQRTAQSLLYHVKYPKNHALERGLMMPTQNGLEAGEAEDLWQWMREAYHWRQP
ncbi:MAG: c-type cytochrome [Oligoflexus sp.]